MGFMLATSIGLSACSPQSQIDKTPATTSATEPLRVTAVVPYWNTGSGARSILDNAGMITTSSPWLLGLDEDGKIVYLTGRPDELVAAETAARSAGMPVQPTIADYSDHVWRDDVVRGILGDPARRAAHIREIVSWAREHGWQGVTLDYERLTGEDREAFSVFVGELAEALRHEGKRLAVDVYAKTDDRGTDATHASQDLAAIGAAADEVRLMTYTYSWETSKPGPVAPPSWVEEVIRYTLTRVPAEKVVLGIPLFGFDWPQDGPAVPVSARDVDEIIAEYRPKMRWDTAGATPWLTYTPPEGGLHQVWFENTCTFAAKSELAEKYGLGGIFLWMYGPENPSLWPALAGTRPMDCGAGGDGARRSGSS